MLSRESPKKENEYVFHKPDLRFCFATFSSPKPLRRHWLCGLVDGQPKRNRASRFQRRKSSLLWSVNIIAVDVVNLYVLYIRSISGHLSPFVWCIKLFTIDIVSLVADKVHDCRTRDDKNLLSIIRTSWLASSFGGEMKSRCHGEINGSSLLRLARSSSSCRRANIRNNIINCYRLICNVGGLGWTDGDKGAFPNLPIVETCSWVWDTRPVILLLIDPKGKRFEAKQSKYKISNKHLFRCCDIAEQSNQSNRDLGPRL